MAHPVLVYDGECAFCRKSIAWYQAHDGARRLAYLSRQSPERALRYPQLDAEQYQGAMQLVLPNGTIHSGADGAATALTYLSCWWWRSLGHLLRAWGMRQLAHIGYRWIAKHRYRLACDTDRCNIK